MPYLGNIPATQFAELKYQDFTGGTGTSFTLNDPVGSAQELEVFVNNVRQEPGVAYTVSGTALTMTGSIVATDDFYVVFQGKSTGTATHPAGQALTATDGTFTGNVDIDGTTTVDGLTSSEALDVTTTTHANASVFKSTGNTQIMLQDTDASANDQFWGLQVSGGDFNILTCNDDRASGFSTPLYINQAGTIVSSSGIAIGGTGAANTLDDFEEGSHVPTVTGSVSGSLTLNSSYNTLAYTKIGRVVHVQGLLIASSVSAGTGYIKITLPFAITSAYTGRTASATFINASSANARDFVSITIENESQLRLYLGDGTNAANDSFQTISANSSDMYVSLTYITDS